MSIFAVNNQSLFSNNYLEHHLPVSTLWSEQRDAARHAFVEIKKAYDQIKSLNLGPGEEAELENSFIRPVLNVLGYEFYVQPSTHRGKNPDYALFANNEAKVSACRDRSNLPSFYSHALTVLEAKYWERRLNDTDAKDKLDQRDPTAQTVKYLDDVNYLSNGRINWAILTNGARWRLFYQRASSRSGNYYEVDLRDMLLKGFNDDFLYFYLFFSRNAFLVDPQTNRSLLDQHIEGSHEYAARISSRLKELVFDNIFECLAGGVIQYRKDELNIQEETDGSLDEIFKGCLTLLYRILFLLYAESRHLLPVRSPGYDQASLLKLRADVAELISNRGTENISARQYKFWAHLENLFNVIAKGDPTCNVPVYNGGLFESQKEGFLATHKISDRHLSEALHALTVDTTEAHSTGGHHFIDYSSLSVRELGDIYEGLLEFHIRVANVGLKAVKQKERVVWKETHEVKEGERVLDVRAPGQVYIENSRRERKATGSYYTPHNIVEHIVKNSVGPVLDARFGLAKELLEAWEKAHKAKKRQRSPDGIRAYVAKINTIENQIFDTVFDVKVLDPAMGSGHFLVHAVDYISERIIKFLAEYPDNPVIIRIDGLREDIKGEIRKQGVRIDESKLTEVNLIKRMVMKRCVYGVDLNAMAVELAKLSLWLDSFTLGAPLSFLDHHLKCGNSLVGVFDISDVVLPNTEAFKKVQRALSFMLQVSNLTDATIVQAKQSHDFFKEAVAAIEPIRRRFDAVTAKYFMDLGNSQSRIEDLAYSMDFDNEPYPDISRKCKSALAVARKHRFFHWRLEFPEAFFTEKAAMENYGFDCVIGNPPYVRHEGLGDFKDDFKDYFKGRYEVYDSSADLYTYFIERGVSLLSKGGIFGYIVANKWMRANYGKRLREWLKSRQIIEITDFGDLPVFKKATTYPCILLIKSDGPAREFRATNVKTLEFDGLSSYIKENSFLINPSSLDPAGWALVNERAGHLLEKLRQTGVPLGEYVKGKINYGIKTGLNEAFVIDEETKNRLIKEDPKSKEIIKPFLLGREIKRYAALKPENYLILFPRGFTRKNMGKEKDAWKWLSKNYSSIANHLAAFKDKAEKRCDQGEFWWELRACDYYPEFEKKKICWGNLCKYTPFTYENNSSYINAPACFFITDDKYILGILNSKIIWHILDEMAAGRQGGYIEAKPMYVSKLPIRTIDFKNKDDKRMHDEMVRLVEEMLSMNEKFSASKAPHEKENLERQIKATDRAIDELVYKLYGLTDEDIRIVEETA